MITNKSEIQSKKQKTDKFTSLKRNVMRDCSFSGYIASVHRSIRVYDAVYPSSPKSACSKWTKKKGKKHVLVLCLGSAVDDDFCSITYF